MLGITLEEILDSGKQILKDQEERQKKMSDFETVGDAAERHLNDLDSGKEVVIKTSGNTVDTPDT